MRKINVNLSDKYPIYVGEKILTSHILVDFCKKLASTIVVITDDNLIDLYAKPLLKHLKVSGIKIHLLSFIATEKNKSRKTKLRLEDQMFQLGCNRDTCIVALGGGITTDMAGFIAATYCRGIPLIYLPTSLLGMVDASIGGKTGVNTPCGKNLIGSFYQPKAIFSDIDTLKTLPKVELKNGIIEVIKHAVIKDHKLFNFLANNANTITNNDPKILCRLVIKNCQIKKQIVELDEQDYTIRQLLNFGHTIGHALEIATDHRMKHGEAVGLGMVAESYISMRLNHLSERSFDKIVKLVEKYLPTKISYKYSKDDVKKALIFDKKAIDKKPMFVLLKNIGEAHRSKAGYTCPVSTKAINEALDYVSCNYSE